MQHNGLTLQIEESKTDGRPCWCFVLYGPSGNISVFSPYFFEIEECHAAAKAFLFNFNHSGIVITDIDVDMKPNLDKLNDFVEKYYHDLYCLVFADQQQVRLPPPQPKQRHLRLVTDDTESQTQESAPAH